MSAILKPACVSWPTGGPWRNKNRHGASDSWLFPRRWWPLPCSGIGRCRTFRKVQYDSFQVFTGVACLFCFFHVVGFLSGEYSLLWGEVSCKRLHIIPLCRGFFSCYSSKGWWPHVLSKAFLPFSPFSSMTKLTYAFSTPRVLPVGKLPPWFRP